MVPDSLVMPSDRTRSNGHELNARVPPQHEEEFFVREVKPWDSSGRERNLLSGDIPNPPGHIPAPNVPALDQMGFKVPSKPAVSVNNSVHNSINPCRQP